MAISKKTKGILSVIGAIFARIAIGIVNPLGYYNIYLISYINHFNQDSPFILDYALLIDAFLSFFFLCFSPLGGILDIRIGCHWTMVISTVIQLLSTIALFFIKGIWGLYCVIILLSIGMGLGFRSPIKNASFFFPENKGFVCALIYGIGGLSSPLFNYIGETIINPHNTILKEDEKYYNFKIAKNLFKYYYLMLIGISVSMIIALLFIFQYRQEDNHRSYNEGGRDANHYIEESTQAHTYSDYNNDIDEEERLSTYRTFNINISLTQIDHYTNELRLRYWDDIKQILISYRIWLLFLITFLGNFLPFMIQISFKVIGTYSRFQILMLKTSTSIMTLVKNGICPLLGYLFDKYGYSPLIKITNISSIAIGILMSLSTYNEVFFGIVIILNSIVIASFRCITDPYIMEIFTIEYSIEIAGIMGIAFGFTSLISTVLVLLTSVLDKKHVAYLIVFMMGAVLNWISLVLSFFEKGGRFVFDRVKTLDNDDRGFNKDKNKDKDDNGDHSDYNHNNNNNVFVGK